MTRPQKAAIERAGARGWLLAGEVDPLLARLEGANTIERELVICGLDCQYFISTYVHILDSQTERWIPFELWSAQVDALDTVIDHQFTLALKSRQVGLTWLMLAYGLWRMLFRPVAEVLLFSKREDEAIFLLADRLNGIYMHLPEWMKPGKVIDMKKHIKLRNGSSARAFPSNAGDSYTATFALIDEADLVPDLKSLLGRVQPTIDAGGKLALISRVDKSKPQSLFKQIYRTARAEENQWRALFLPWYAHPGRDQDWYEAQRRDAMRNEGSLDSVYEQYPATDAEALAPAMLDKRIPHAWIDQCYAPMRPLPLDDLPDNAPGLPGLRVYRLPEAGRVYTAGVDTAEGLPGSDDSAITLVERMTGEEVCNLVGKLTPAVTAAYAGMLLDWYNRADVMVENNNHGHAVIGWLSDNGYRGRVLEGHNGKPGWSSTSLGKVLLYDCGAETFKNEETTIHDMDTLTQIKSIESGTLRAPGGEHDDRADSYMLALAGRVHRARNNTPRMLGARGLYASRK